MSRALAQFKQDLRSALPNTRWSWELYEDMRRGTVSLLYAFGPQHVTIAFTWEEIETLRPLGKEKIDPIALRRLIAERLAGAEEWLRDALKPDLQIAAAG